MTGRQNAPLPGSHLDGRVAIPRSSTEVVASGRKPRASRACEACRLRKIKCDGVTPRCNQCEEQKTTCVYSDVKRVRDRKRLDHLSVKVDKYEKLFQEVIPVVDDHLARKIRRALKVRNLPGT